MVGKLKINTKDESLREILGNGKSYFVPKFQRDYSWETEQWEMLWEDIEAMVQDDESYHYMGYLVLQEFRTNTFKIIDGQQRLTSFSLLVLAAIKRLKESRVVESERIDELQKSFIGTKDLVKLQTTNKLTLNRNNDYYYRQAVGGKDFPSRGMKQTVHLMGKAFHYFYKVLEGKTGEEIGLLIEKASQNLCFTTIFIGDEFNAYKVFETLNARGTQLTTGDLLKNYIFSLIDSQGDTPDEILSRLEEKWEHIGNDIGDNRYTDYILCQWNSTHHLVRKTDLFRRIRSEVNTPKEADDYLDRLADNSQLYAALLNYDHEFWKDNPAYQFIRKDLYFFRMFNLRQHLSLLFIAYRKHRDKFSKIIRWIKNFSMRYNVICREHTGDQEAMYNRICLSIAKDCSLGTIKKEINSLYPDDKKFKQEFMDKTMPTEQSNKKTRYLLARLEEYSQDTAIDEEKLTVEHILPLHPKEEWCEYFGQNWQFYNQRIGNMALVTKGMNKNIGQELFPAKKTALLESSFGINRMLSDYDEWNSQSIESRQRDLAEIAINLWRID